MCDLLTDDAELRGIEPCFAARDTGSIYLTYAAHKWARCALESRTCVVGVRRQQRHGVNACEVDGGVAAVKGKPHKKKLKSTEPRK